jgi:hypothetical protein
MTENSVSPVSSTCFSKSIPEGKCAQVDPGHRYRPRQLSLVFSCLEISDRAKYAGWNDLHDLDDLHDFDAQQGRKDRSRFIKLVSVGEIAILD